MFCSNQVSKIWNLFYKLKRCKSVCTEHQQVVYSLIKVWSSFKKGEIELCEKWSGKEKILIPRFYIFKIGKECITILERIYHVFSKVFYLSKWIFNLHWNVIERYLNYLNGIQSDFSQFHFKSNLLYRIRAILSFLVYRGISKKY